MYRRINGVKMNNDYVTIELKLLSLT